MEVAHQPPVRFIDAEGLSRFRISPDEYLAPIVIEGPTVARSMSERVGDYLKNCMNENVIRAISRRNIGVYAKDTFLTHWSIVMSGVFFGVYAAIAASFVVPILSRVIMGYCDGPMPLVRDRVHEFSISYVRNCVAPVFIAFAIVYGSTIVATLAILAFATLEFYTVLNMAGTYALKYPYRASRMCVNAGVMIHRYDLATVSDLDTAERVDYFEDYRDHADETNDFMREIFQIQSEQTQLPTETAEPEDIGEDSVCSICLEPNRENVVYLDGVCKHNFHKDCIDQWTRRKKECPFCRATPSVFGSAPDIPPGQVHYEPDEVIVE